MPQAVLVLFVAPVLAGEHDLPDPRLTPGAIAPGVTASDICQPGYATSARHLAAAVKRHVFEAYGLSGNHAGYCGGDEGCEVDHLISLELGGANDMANLWPEPYDGTPWNAHVKDRLENKLHCLVCDGAITLEAAQMVIRTNWVEAYIEYVGELPLSQTGDE